MRTDTQQLLADYRADGSERAFRELVARYLDLVYSTALRLVEGDTHRAEDVTQAVFADLARMAAKLSPHTMLGGWLHRHTCYVASSVMRGERRRQARERQAVEMNALQNQPDSTLAELAPVLDEAIHELGPDDRDAILLRFFERQDLRSVGAALGINENVAQKRVARAVQELAVLLRQRGVVLSATALASCLAAEAVKAAPASLGLTLAKTALAGSAAAAGSAAVSSSVTAMTSLKLWLAGLLLVGGLATTGFLHYKAKTAAHSASPAGTPAAVPSPDATTGSPPAQPVYRPSPRDLPPAAPKRRAEASPGAELALAAAAEPPAASVSAPEPSTPAEPPPPLVRFTAKPGSRVRIDGTSNLHDWQVEGSIIGGTLSLGASFLQTLAPAPQPGPVPAQAEVFIPLRSLKSVEKNGKPYSDKMDEIMYGKLQSADSRIHYYLKELTLTGTTNVAGAVWCQCDSRGDLVVAGATNRIVMPVRLLPEANNRLRITGAVGLKMTSFGIEPPSPKITFGLIKTGDKVDLSFEWVVAAKEPLTSAAAPAPAGSPPTVPLLLDLPAPAFRGTPPNTPLNANVEPLSDKPRPALLVPPGLVNLARGARISSSDNRAPAETLAKIIDGDKEASDESVIFLRKGVQWVQLDLGLAREVFAIVVWHAHNSPKVYRDVVVQLANSPDFSGNVKTLFNNDLDNTAGLGAGPDREYFETREGRLINAHGAAGRFLRFYSQGSNESALNEYTEIEVYGRPTP